MLELKEKKFWARTFYRRVPKPWKAGWKVNKFSELAKVFKEGKVRWVAVCQRGAMDSASDF